MAQFCSSCGGQVPDGVAFCSGCGAKTSPPTNSSLAVASGQTSTTNGLTDNIAGLLAYITIIPAIIFLVVEPYNKRKFPRFHSFQSIFFFVACVAAAIALSILGMIPVVRWFTVLLWPLVGLAELIIWVILLIKANAGQMYKLPVIGDMAAQQAGE